MNFEPSEDQAMIAGTFARFLDENSSCARVRAALPLGHDPALWRGLAELGAFGIRVPEASGGTGLTLFDAVLFMEEAGRTLASGPIAETIVAARVLAAAGEGALLEQVLAGEKIVSIAYHDSAKAARQWVAGGAVADHVLAREGGALYLVTPEAAEKAPSTNLASTPMAEIFLGPGAGRRKLAETAHTAFLSGLEEWKLLIAAALAGLGRQAIRLASSYASERAAFGQLIGTYQGISHPLADRFADVDGGKLYVWKAAHDVAHGLPGAAANIPLALWWNARAATRAAAQSLHTFGGYGLTTEYDIHLYALRAKAWPLMAGDPADLLAEAASRRYANAPATLPEQSEISIDFDIGDDARALAAEVDEFFKKTLTPELKAKAHYSFDGHDAGVHKKLAEAKLLFLNWPDEYGGRRSTPYAINAARAMWEEHGWSSHAIGVTQMVGMMIQRYGTDELKRDVLTRIVSGDAICSLGYSEPGSGSDVFAAKTRATPEGNGWRIDGQKMFTSGANIADYVLMLTRTDPDVPKHKGLTMFIVPLKTEGVTIQPVYTFQDERTNITFYDGVKIPDTYRLGEVNGGTKVMAAALEMEHGGGFLKTQSHMLHEAEVLAGELTRNGSRLIDDPNVAARLARVYADNEVTEVLTNRALWWSVQKKPNIGYGSMIKLFSSECFLTDSADLLDLLAPESLSNRNKSAAFINQCFRHAQGTTIYGGTSEVHRSMVAERGLNLPRTRA